MSDNQPWWNDKDKVGGLFATAFMGILFLLALAGAIKILQLVLF